MTEADQVFERCARLIRERDHVTFAELGREFPEHFDVADNLSVGISESNIIFWIGLSDVGAEVCKRLAETFDRDPCSLLTYIIDGKMLSLPLAKRARKYVEPHWLPLVFRKHPPRRKN